MTRLEKLEMAIEMGYTYNPENGKIYSRFGREISNKNNKGYLIIYNRKFTLRAHQFAFYFMNKEVVEEIDHINGIKDDNRICNLRSVTRQQNMFNTKAKGYSWHKASNKWKARIMVNHKDIHLGLFNTEDEAREAYINAKEKLHII